MTDLWRLRDRVRDLRETVDLMADREALSMIATLQPAVQVDILVDILLASDELADLSEALAGRALILSVMYSTRGGCRVDQPITHSMPAGEEVTQTCDGSQ